MSIQDIVNEHSIERIQTRIAVIDKMFREATGWGSWMDEASGERQELVSRAHQLGAIIPRQVRASGSPSD